MEEPPIYHWKFDKSEKRPYLSITPDEKEEEALKWSLLFMQCYPQEHLRVNERFPENRNFDQEVIFNEDKYVKRLVELEKLLVKNIKTSELRLLFRSTSKNKDEIGVTNLLRQIMNSDNNQWIKAFAEILPAEIKEDLRSKIWSRIGGNSEFMDLVNEYVLLMRRFIMAVAYFHKNYEQSSCRALLIGTLREFSTIASNRGPLVAEYLRIINTMLILDIVYLPVEYIKSLPQPLNPELSAYMDPMEYQYQLAMIRDMLFVNCMAANGQPSLALNYLVKREHLAILPIFINPEYNAHYNDVNWRKMMESAITYDLPFVFAYLMLMAKYFNLSPNYYQIRNLLKTKINDARTLLKSRGAIGQPISESLSRDFWQAIEFWHSKRIQVFINEVLGYNTDHLSNEKKSRASITVGFIPDYSQQFLTSYTALGREVYIPPKWKLFSKSDYQRTASDELGKNFGDAEEEDDLNLLLGTPLPIPAGMIEEISKQQTSVPGTKDKGKGPMYDPEGILEGVEDYDTEEEDYLTIPSTISGSESSTTSLVIDTLRKDPEWVELKQRQIEALTYNPSEVVIPSPKTLSTFPYSEQTAKMVKCSDYYLLNYKKNHPPVAKARMMRKTNVDVFFRDEARTKLQKVLPYNYRAWDNHIGLAQKVYANLHNFIDENVYKVREDISRRTDYLMCVIEDHFDELFQHKMIQGGIGLNFRTALAAKIDAVYYELTKMYGRSARGLKYLLDESRSNYYLTVTDPTSGDYPRSFDYVISRCMANDNIQMLEEFLLHRYTRYAAQTGRVAIQGHQYYVLYKTINYSVPKSKYQISIDSEAEDPDAPQDVQYPLYIAAVCNSYKMLFYLRQLNFDFTGDVKRFPNMVTVLDPVWQEGRDKFDLFMWFMNRCTYIKNLEKADFLMCRAIYFFTYVNTLYDNNLRVQYTKAPYETLPPIHHNPHRSRQYLSMYRRCQRIYLKDMQLIVDQYNRTHMHWLGQLRIERILTRQTSYSLPITYELYKQSMDDAYATLMHTQNQKLERIRTIMQMNFKKPIDSLDETERDEPVVNVMEMMGALQITSPDRNPSAQNDDVKRIDSIVHAIAEEVAEVIDDATEPLRNYQDPGNSPTTAEIVSQYVIQYQVPETVVEDPGQSSSGKNKRPRDPEATVEQEQIGGRSMRRARITTSTKSLDPVDRGSTSTGKR